MAILALMSGLVLISLPGDPDPVEEDARAIATMLNRAAQSALNDGATRTLALSETEWALRRFDESGWRDLNSANFTTQSVRLFIETAPVELTDDMVPHIIFEPSGEATSFRLELQNRDSDWYLTGTPSGQILVEAGRVR